VLETSVGMPSQMRSDRLSNGGGVGQRCEKGSVVVLESRMGGSVMVEEEKLREGSIMWQVITQGKRNVAGNYTGKAQCGR
jgi:hypothetical protein